MPPYTSASRPAAAEIQKLIASIGDRFAIQGAFLLGEEIDSGHINSTYRASYLQPDGSQRRYIFQAINRYVFKDPYAVMRNVERVTRHINAKVLRKKHDLGGQTLNLYPARSGGSWVEDEKGTVWRCYNNIEGCITHDVVDTPTQAYQAARAFGAFQDLVSDLDAALIEETIPDFHHTRKRLATLMETAAADPLGRLASSRREFDFILEHEASTGTLIDLTSNGAIPLRIAHNDTKINNVMIDEQTGEAVCVIDLDTVMPGLSLHDFGDLVRTATSPAAEDETDLTKVAMRMPVFEALVRGYLETAGSFLNETEIDHLAFSGKLIALELGMRFLTDHLQGDIYFKIHRPGQNLDRCRTQLRLAAAIGEQESRMRDFVWKTAGNSR